MGEDLGLSEKALDKFAYTCYQVGIEIDVYESQRPPAEAGGLGEALSRSVDQTQGRFKRPSVG